MLIPNNYSSSSPVSSSESIDISSVYDMASSAVLADGMDQGMDEYHSVQKSNLKRKSDSSGNFHKRHLT